MLIGENKTRSRTRLPDLEESSTRSNVKTMSIRCLDITLAKNILKRAIKGHSHIGLKNYFLVKHHVLHSHQIDLESVEIVDWSSAWRQRLIFEFWRTMRDMNFISEYIALHLQ